MLPIKVMMAENQDSVCTLPKILEISELKGFITEMKQFQENSRIWKIYSKLWENFYFFYGTLEMQIFHSLLILFALFSLLQPC